MNESKLPAASVDAERLVRELLKAFNSLKRTPAPATSSSPREGEQQRAAQSQEGSSKAFKPVGDAQSTTSADPRPLPRTPLEPLTGTVSNIDGRESKQISAYEKSSPHKIIEEFRRDHELIERLRVTSHELQALSSASLLGSLTCKQDVLFMLRQIREARNPAALQAAVPPEPLYLPGENIEPSQPSFSEMAERIRHESLAKLTAWDDSSTAHRRSALAHFGVFSSALVVLMAAITWACFKMMSIARGARFDKAGNSKILVSSVILFVASVVVGMCLRRSRPVTPSSGTI